MDWKDNPGQPRSDAQAPDPTGRRAFMAAAATAAATAFAGSALAQERDRGYGPDAPPVRYPEPDVVVIDKKFAKYKIGNTPIQRLYTGTQWAEGPAWCAAGKYLVWSDIPNSVHMRYLSDDNHVGVFHSNSNYSNGNTFDWEGRLLSCEHGTRRVVRYEHNGTVSVLTDKFQGKPYNAPNDLIVHPDGGIWFTDPGYGSMGNYEGFKGELQQKEAVYRIDGKTGKTEKVLDDMYKPNGLCFSPDYKKIYIADTGATSFPDAPRNIRVYDLNGTTKVRNGREFTSTKMSTKSGEMLGLADGIRADTDGNIWVVWAGRARVTTACTSSRRRANASGRSSSRKSAPTSASAARAATACSWPPANRSTPSPLKPRARTSRDGVRDCRPLQVATAGSRGYGG